MVVGDTARIAAKALTADGKRVGWSGSNNFVSVDSDGRVIARAAGLTRAIATAQSSGMQSTNAGIYIVNADTSAQPFITLFRHAANGDTLFRRQGFIGVDSVDISISYILGRNAQLFPGDSNVVLEIRSLSGATLAIGSVASIAKRDKVLKADVRVQLTANNSNGTKRFPSGFYDFFVTTPGDAGRVLGSQIWYRVQF